MPRLTPVPDSLKTFLAQKALARGPKTLVVAVSGGADSVALLRAAAEVGPTLGWQVEALHCDHGLRSASKAEARFVDSLCNDLGLTLYAYRGGLKKGTGVEERARTWRRSCYAHAAHQSGASLVLLAHHAQDQAETLLLNLIRGAGETGAQGMLPLAPLEGAPKVHLGRPLLGLLPLELRAYLRSLRQTWKEDASNRDTKLARNRVRHRILPDLLAINPKAIENLAAFATRSQAGKRTQSLAGLLKLSAGARKRAQEVLKAGHGQVDLEKGWTLQVSGGQSRVSKDAAKSQKLRSGQPLEWAGWSIQLNPAKLQARKLKEGKAFWFSPALADKPVILRVAKDGERLAAFGLQGSKLVRDLLAEAKVPAWQRAAWPVLEADGRLVAVLGVRRGQGFEAQVGAPSLQLTWKTPF